MFHSLFSHDTRKAHSYRFILIWRDCIEPRLRKSDHIKQPNTQDFVHRTYVKTDFVHPHRFDDYLKEETPLVGKSSRAVSKRTRMCIWKHNFGSRYARKSVKGSKDADHSIVSNQILNQKNGSLGWRPGPGKVSLKGEIIPQLWRHLQKTPNLKRKILNLN